MARKKTSEQVAQIVESEGLGYAIQSYLSPNEIKDKELADLWREAAEIMNEIEAYLRGDCNED